MAKHQNNLRRALISFDWAIKRVLRNKTNFGVLEGFLSELLQQPIVVEDLMESSTNKAHAKDKFMVVDIVCKATSGELYLIELQFGAELDYFQRMLFGTSKMIADHLEEGEQYLKIPKLHSIHIVYFDLGTGEDCIYHGRTEFTGIKKSDKLQLNAVQKKKFQKSTPSGIFPEYWILKIDKFDGNIQNPIDEWLYYLQNSQLPTVFQAKGLAELNEQHNLDTMDVKEKNDYRKFKEGLLVSQSTLDYWFEEGMERGIVKGIEKGIEQGIEKGIEKGIEQGIEKGIEQGMVKGLSLGAQQQQALNVSRLFQKGFEPKQIADFLEIDFSEVLEILEKNRNSQ